MKKRLFHFSTYIEIFQCSAGLLFKYLDNKGIGDGIGKHIHTKNRIKGMTFQVQKISTFTGYISMH